MRTLPCYQVDAFTREIFRGNPAAVCPLDEWLDDGTLQAIAAENNVSETAFFVARDDGTFELRWFTPEVEVELCGHATLSAALVLMTELGHDRSRVRFTSKSGPLDVLRQGDAFTLDFPEKPARPLETAPGLAEALGHTPDAVLLGGRDWMPVFSDAGVVSSLEPDLTKIAALECRAVCVTAPGTGADADVDFVSRFFAPRLGVPEDPVTGSAHCMLTPYWAARLGKTRLSARQKSRRRGELVCEIAPSGRVLITGHGVLVKAGTIRIPAAPLPRTPGLALG